MLAEFGEGGMLKMKNAGEAVVFGRDLGLFLLQFVQQVVGRNFHFAEGEPLLAQIFERSANVVNRVVNAKETVVGIGEGFGSKRRILGVMAVNVELQLRRPALSDTACTAARSETERVWNVSIKQFPLWFSAPAFPYFGRTTGQRRCLPKHSA